jgi:hypothetical protein
MKTLAYNCRGARCGPAVRALLEVQGRCDPDIVFLSETHLDKVGAEKLRVQMRMFGALVAESDGRSGGLIMFWKREIDVQLRAIRPNYIDVMINGNDAVTNWRLTGIYGEPSWSEKYKTWERLRELHGQINSRWMVIGDWNEILYSHEKEGGILDRFSSCKRSEKPSQIVLLKIWGIQEIFSRGEEKEPGRVLV